MDQEPLYSSHMGKVILKMTRKDLFKKLNLDMDAIYKECSDRNWDGYDAEPITEKALNHGNFLLRDIFGSVDLKYLEHLEVAPCNYGNIGFDWFKDHDNQVSVDPKHEWGDIVDFICVSKGKTVSGTGRVKCLNPFVRKIYDTRIDIMIRYIKKICKS